jgi:hypothetical protein
MSLRPDPEAARRLVMQNAPTSETYAVGSFVESLFEDGSFDAVGCQALEAALLALIDAPALAAETDRFVFSIYRLVALQLLCHLNPNDVSGVDNLDDDAVIDLKNRLDFVVGNYFFREHFEIDAWWSQWRSHGKQAVDRLDASSQD